MAMKTAQQANQAWKDSQTKATTNYGDGVQAYTGDWAQATVAQEQVLLTNVTQAISSGLWANKVRAKGTQGWKTDTIAKKANFTTGFTAGAPNQLASATKIMAALGNLVPALPARGTYDQNKQRWAALVDGLHALKGTLGAT